jgi:bacteriocin biosynthesis cyclodehydratase domain-containing protein
MVPGILSHARQLSLSPVAILCRYSSSYFEIAIANVRMKVGDFEGRFFRYLEGLQARDEGSIASEEAGSADINTSLDEVVQGGPELIDAFIKFVCLLENARILINGGAESQRGTADPFLHHLSFLSARSPKITPNRDPLGASRILVEGNGEVAHSIRTRLDKTGYLRFPSGRPKGDRTLVILCGSCYNETELGQRGQKFMSPDYVHLYVSGSALFGRIGPLVVPGESACYQCYLDRERIFRESSDRRELYAESGVPEKIVERTFDQHSCSESLSSELLAMISVNLALKVYLGVEPLLTPAEIMSVDLALLAFERQRVLKMPRCRSCAQVRGARPPLGLRDGSDW